MKVKGFRGEYRWLSNFYKSPVTLWGVKFDTVEQAYQASKCSNRSDWDMMVGCKTPGDAKRKGRLITIRPDFESIKLDIMYQLLFLKFSDPYFKNKLIRIKDYYIEETNWWGDTYWGVCNGVGENNLGKLIMKIAKALN